MATTLPMRSYAAASSDTSDPLVGEAAIVRDLRLALAAPALVLVRGRHPGRAVAVGVALAVRSG